MANISKTNIYTFDDNISLGDYLIGTDKDRQNRTKSYRVGDLLAYIIQETGIISGNQILSGQIIWLQDRDFLITDLSYYLAGNIYEIQDTVITVPDADSSFNRFDLIYGNTSGEILLKQGEPVNPTVRPTLDDPSTEIKISFIFSQAGQPLPQDVSKIVIYSDNVPEDWSNNSDIDPGIIDFDAVTTPQAGTKCIVVKGLLDVNKNIEFQLDSGNVPYNATSQLMLYIKLDSITKDQTTGFRIWLENEFGNQSLSADIVNGSYGFNFSNMDDYQAIVIPLSELSGLDNFTKLNIQVEPNFNVAFRLDTIEIVNTGANIPLYNSYLALIDTLDDTYTGKETYSPVVVNGQLVLQPVSADSNIKTTTYNGKITRYIKHPLNPQNNPFEQNDYILDHVWSNTLLIDKARYLGGIQSDINSLDIVSSTDIPALI